MTAREALHQLVDTLPEDLLTMAEARLVALRDDKLLRFLMEAPLDDEPLDEEDLAALAEARAAFARGETIPWEMVREEIRREAECHDD